jgi:membrane protease YdiL (CAAX protease family)
LQLVLLVMASGLLIGFVEELLYRGIAVKMLRNGGAREWSVAALSSLLFAASHSVNVLSGIDVATVGATLFYTFAFGVLMYLTMRATGFIVFAMILHGLTDPTTILVSGGIDQSSPTISGNQGLLLYAALATFLVYAMGYLLLIFIRGKAGETTKHHPSKAYEQHATDAPAMKGQTS